KGGKRREVGLDAWGWRTLEPWLEYRRQLPVGALFCVLHGPSRGRPWSPAAVRSEPRRAAAKAGVRRRLAPHQLRHATCLLCWHRTAGARHRSAVPPRGTERSVSCRVLGVRAARGVNVRSQAPTMTVDLRHLSSVRSPPHDGV